MNAAALTSAPVITDLAGLLTSVLAAIVVMLIAVPVCMGFASLLRVRRSRRAGARPSADIDHVGDAVSSPTVPVDVITTTDGLPATGHDLSAGRRPGVYRAVCGVEVTSGSVSGPDGPAGHYQAAVLGVSLR